MHRIDSYQGKAARGLHVHVAVAALVLLSYVVGTSAQAVDEGGPLARLSTGNAVREFRAWQTAGMERDQNTDVHWVALSKKLGPEWRGLDSLGVKYLGFYRHVGPLYIYRMDFAGAYDGAVKRLKTCEAFVNALPLQQAEKLSADLWSGVVPDYAYVDSQRTRVRIDVSFYDKAGVKRAANILRGYVDSILFVQQESPCHVGAVTRPDLCRLIASLPEVASVVTGGASRVYMPGIRHDAYIDTAQRFDTTSQKLPLPPTTTTMWSSFAADTLTGKGVTVGIYDVGLDATPGNIQLDFREYDTVHSDTVLRHDSTWDAASYYHGTMVAGIAAGNGWGSSLDSTHAPRYLWRGVAPQSKLYANTTGPDDGRYGDVNNHSRGWWQDPPDGGAYYYNASATSFTGAAAQDVALATHDTTSRSRGGNGNNIIVKAGCNSGNAPPPGYEVSTPAQGYYSSGASKNAIRVQYVDKYTNGHHTYGSSLGPSYDGRIGFDVVAPVGCPDLNDYFDVEVDYIRLQCTGASKQWDFNSLKDATCDSLWWGCHSLLINLRRGAGDSTIAFQMTNRYMYIWSDSTAFPNDTSASLVMRYKISDANATGTFEKGLLRPLAVGMFWRTPTDTGFSAPWGQPHVEFYAWVNAGWQTVVVPLSRAHQMPNQNTYATDAVWGTAQGPSIRRIGIGFATIGPLTTGFEAQRAHRMYRYQHYVGGASNAAPVVTGTVALMLQKYQDRILPYAGRGWPGKNIHDRPFWNSTARAILIHTATDLIHTERTPACSACANPEFKALGQGDTIDPVYGPGPDWVTGWGLLNAYKALAYVDTNRFREDTIGDGGLRYYSMHVPQSTQKLRVTIVWDDPPPAGVQDASNAFDCKLVNDLDLYLIPPSGNTVFRPWFLDYSHIKGRTVPTTTGIDESFFNGAYHVGISPDTVLAYPAKPGINRIENNEVVDVTMPDTGQWLVVVEGHDIQDSQSIAGSAWQPKQDVSLVSDLLCTPTQAGHDSLGLMFGYGAGVHGRATSQGYLQLQAQKRSGSPAGLRFVGASTTVSLDTSGYLQCDSVLQNQGTWLGNAGNLSGGLVWRNPNGVVAAHIASDGKVRVRKSLLSGMGAM